MKNHGTLPVASTAAAVFLTAVIALAPASASATWCVEVCAGNTLFCTCEDDDGTGYTYACGSCADDAAQLVRPGERPIVFRGPGLEPRVNITRPGPLPLPSWQAQPKSPPQPNGDYPRTRR